MLGGISRHLVFDVLFYEREDCPLKGDSGATINSLSSQKYLDTLKNMFVERSTQYTSFSSRKQPANAGTERKQFTEDVSVALQQPTFTHAYTKCPPVVKNIFQGANTTAVLVCCKSIHLTRSLSLLCYIFFSFTDVNASNNFACNNFGVSVESCRQVKL